MDMEIWIKLLGKTQDDAALKAALTAAGVKRVPKLPKDDYSVIFDLKGHGMSLEMTDEAEVKDLDDQDIGEGPLILTGVDAYIVRVEVDVSTNFASFSVVGLPDAAIRESSERVRA